MMSWIRYFPLHWVTFIVRYDIVALLNLSNRSFYFNKVVLSRYPNSFLLLWYPNIVSLLSWCICCSYIPSLIYVIWFSSLVMRYLISLFDWLWNTYFNIATFDVLLFVAFLHLLIHLVKFIAMMKRNVLIKKSIISLLHYHLFSVNFIFIYIVLARNLIILTIIY